VFFFFFPSAPALTKVVSQDAVILRPSQLAFGREICTAPAGDISPEFRGVIGHRAVFGFRCARRGTTDLLTPSCISSRDAVEG